MRVNKRQNVYHLEMEKKMGKKLTKKERNWILYDVGNSAFTLLIATILPIYFNYLAGNAGISSVNYLAYWGYAASVGTILVALDRKSVV